MKLALLILAYALGMAGANLCLKMNAGSTGWQAWAWFIAANATGFTCVVVLPFALKLAPSNLVYAWAIGLGFLLLQLGAWLVFREPLSPVQWSGVVLFGVATVLLQWK